MTEHEALIQLAIPEPEPFGQVRQSAEDVARWQRWRDRTTEALLMVRALPDYPGRAAVTGDEIFEAVAAYLNQGVWYQDGDDPGVWLPDGVRIGTALEAQLERDGVSPWMVSDGRAD